MTKSRILCCMAFLGGLLFVSLPSARIEKTIAEPLEEERNWGGLKAEPFDYRYGGNSDITSEELYSTVFPLNFQYMNVKDSWKDYRGETIDQEPVTVAIIDSGINVYHEDFLTPAAQSVTITPENVLNYSILDPKSCFIHDKLDKEDDDWGCYLSNVVTEVGILKAFDDDDTTYDSEYDEYYSHGTASASCVGAAVNGVGGWGIAPKANLLIIKIDFAFTSLDKAIRYAANNGADVINMSLGAYPTKEGDGTSTYLSSAINYALSKDVVVVAAAGNEKTDSYSYPACNDGVIGVGALAKNSGTSAASYSNYNKSSDTATGNHNVDVMAPGTVYTANVKENGPHKTEGNRTEDFYYETQGTSFACPLTAGSVALARAKYPDWTHTQIEQKLFDSCFDIGNTGWDSKFGYGRVDVEKLLEDTALQSISLEPSERNLSVGDELDLKVNFNPANASNKEVLFLSDDNSIATVDENGHVVAIADGVTRIGCLPDELGVEEAYMTVNVGESNWTEAGQAPAGWFRVEDVSELTAGSVITFGREASEKISGSLNGPYLDAVSATFDTTDHHLDELPEGAETFTVGVNNNKYSFKFSSSDEYLSNSGKSLASSETAQYWSVSIDGGSASVIGESSKPLSYNASSPRWKTYDNLLDNGDFEIYKNSGGSQPVDPTPVTHILNPIAGDNSVEVDSKITLSTSCNQSDAITWNFTGEGAVGFGSGKTASATGNSVDVYGISAGSVTVTATCEGSGSVNKAITVTPKSEPTPTPTPAGDGDFEKVVENEALTSGDYLIVCEDQEVAFDGSLASLDAVDNCVDVEINDGVIAGAESLYASVFTFDAEQGSLRSASGKYISQSSNSNGMVVSDSPVSNTVSLNEGLNIDVVCNYARLRFNAGKDQMRFRYFKSSSYSSQTAIQFYKLVDNGPRELTGITATVSKTFHPGESISASDFTVKATYNKGSSETVENFTFNPSAYSFTYADAPSGGSVGNKVFSVSALGYEVNVSVKVARTAYQSVDNVTLSLNGMSFSGKIGSSKNTATTGEVTLNGITYDFVKAYNYNGKLSFGDDNTGSMRNITPFDKPIRNISVSDQNDIKPRLQLSADGENFVTYSAQAASSGNYRYFRLDYVGVSVSSYTNITALTFTFDGTDTCANVANYIMFEDTENQCTSKLDLAIRRLNNCTVEDITSYFVNGEGYVATSAKARLEAWAAHEGKTLSWVGGTVTLSPASAKVAPSSGTDNSSAAVLILSLFSLALIGTSVFLLVKRKTNKA